MLADLRQALRLLARSRGLAMASVLILALGIRVPAAQSRPWRSAFAIAPGDLTDKGSQPYFILEPGYRSVLESGGERLVITVLDETRSIDGTRARVVEERETKNSALVEISRNYFAMSRRTGDVYYLGEEVDIFKDGRVSSHEGAWISGAGGARFGLMMPGTIAVRDRYYQEVAPGIAMDRAEIVSVSETVRVPAGTFTGCLKMEETTPLEPGVKEYKYYARGVGLVMDGDLKLVRYGTAAPSSMRTW